MSARVSSESWKVGLDASIVAELRPELVAGVGLAGGAPTGHAAIVARALEIPLALSLGDAFLSVPKGEEVIVDGTLGRERRCHRQRAAALAVRAGPVQRGVARISSVRRPVASGWSSTHRRR
jgi:hypothetical protein